MRAGRLRHRIEIQRATVTRDAMGGEIKAWQTTAIRWANVVPLAGREYFAGQAGDATVSHRIELRYLPGIVPSMRVKTGDRVLDIEAVLDIEGRHRELHLMATEAVA
jgi:SPP1 family predicted phage head-tail adaptor